MITRPYVRAVHVLRHRLPFIVFMTIYVTLVVILVKLGNDWIDVPIAIPAMLGTALSILLGFRVSSSYDRWWEARKIWGAIVNDSRTFTRQVLTYMFNEDDKRPLDIQKDLVYRQIAWTYALSRSLRHQDPLADTNNFLSSQETEQLRVQDNVPNALLQTQAVKLGEVYRQGLLDKFFFLSVGDTLKRFTDHMGMCERIKNTVFPGHYSFFLSRTLLIFSFLLPLGLVPYLGWVTIPVALMIHLLFMIIEETGRVLQDPFENRSTDTPMTTLARTIEINLRQQLGETELPEKIQPVDGVLM